MVNNKLDHVNGILSQLNKELQFKENELNETAEIQEHQLKYLNTQENLGEYDDLKNDILEVTKEITNIKTRMHFIKEEIEKYNKLHEKILIIYDNIKQSLVEYNNNLKTFNSYFSQYTNELYGDQYFVSIYNTKNGHFDDIIDYKLRIQGVKERSTGSRRSLIYAFDVAYLKFSIELDLHVPYFSYMIS